MQQNCDPLIPESSRAALKLQTFELDAGLRALAHVLARQAAHDAVQPCDPDQTKVITANQAQNLSK